MFKSMFLRKLIIRKQFFRIWRVFYVLSLRGMGILNYENSSVSGEVDFLKKVLKGKMVIFDVGANVGKYSEMVKSFSKESIVYAFEPHPKTFEVLKHSDVGQLDHVYCICAALSDGNEEGEIFDYQDNDGSSHASLFQDVITNSHKKDCISHKIEIRTLDSVARDLEITHIDLLKIDVEGNELNVLKGAGDLLKNERIRIIQFEFNEFNIISKSRLADFFELLPEYDFFRMLPDGVVKLEYNPVFCEIFAFQNIVAVRKNSGIILQ